MTFIRRSAPWLVVVVCTGSVTAGCGGPTDLEEPSGVAESALTAAAAPAVPGWTALTNPIPAFLDTCLLLTDGTVMCHQFNTNAWYRLTPDAFGSYKNGTWSAMPSMPNGNDPANGCTDCTYAPLYFASAVLKDSRAFVLGGEYNSLAFTWTNIGFIYDPVSNQWSNQLQEAFGGGNVGDTQSVILQDGTLLISNINTTNMEALNPATGVFTAKNPTGKLDTNDEEGWTIMYDGSLLTIDSRVVSSFERYTPSTNSWGNAGSTPVNLTDFGTGSGNSQEVGPCVHRPDSKVFCFSGNTLGQNALYTISSNSWSHTSNMDFPPGPNGGSFSVPDGPAAALPNGNILVMASPTTTSSDFNAPSHFYEVSLSTNALTAVGDPPNAASYASVEGRMLVLPTGEVLLTAYNQGAIQDVMLYSNGGGPQSNWRPIVTSAPSTIAAGGVYTITGRQLNGFSEGASFGDDAQSSTNYPLVRITNQASGHVIYARTFNHSRMGVEAVGSTATVTTNFQVPRTGFETGTSTLEVVANGIASTPRTVTSGACPTNTQTCHPDSGPTFCGPTNWGFEWGQPPPFWGNSAETNSSPSAAQHHSGSMSLSITPSSDPALPASIDALPCTDTVVGTMDVRGKTYSAWVFVANSSSSYANTRCRLRAFNRSFQESQLPASATKAPIVPGSWFQLTGVFPSTTLESQIYEITVDCNLPADWAFDDPTKVWFVDDARVQ
jgi:hypothetical protein